MRPLATPGSEGFELVTLRNGARAVRHTGHGEVMHPSIGPWQEACRLYVEQSRLAERLQLETAEPLRVIDVGLGAATNAAAVLRCALELGARLRRPLELWSLELYLEPLKLALGDPDGFPYLVPLRPMIEAVLANGTFSDGRVNWTLLVGDALERLAEVPPSQLVLFDPFSPKANPGLWTPQALSAVRGRCAEEATLYTYSAATPTRVSLLLAGFEVGVGWSIGTKGETTVAATARALLEKPLDLRWLQRWERSSARGAHGEPYSEALDRQVRARFEAAP